MLLHLLLLELRELHLTLVERLGRKVHLGCLWRALVEVEAQVVLRDWLRRLLHRLLSLVVMNVDLVRSEQGLLVSPTFLTETIELPVDCLFIRVAVRHIVKSNLVAVKLFPDLVDALVLLGLLVIGRVVDQEERRRVYIVHFGKVDLHSFAGRLLNALSVLEVLLDCVHVSLEDALVQLTLILKQLVLLDGFN